MEATPQRKVRPRAQRVYFAGTSGNTSSPNLSADHIAYAPTPASLFHPHKNKRGTCSGFKKNKKEDEELDHPRKNDPRFPGHVRNTLARLRYKEKKMHIHRATGKQRCFKTEEEAQKYFDEMYDPKGIDELYFSVHGHYWPPQERCERCKEIARREQEAAEKIDSVSEQQGD